MELFYRIFTAMIGEPDLAAVELADQASLDAR
jgi:hypothetical protein